MCSWTGTPSGFLGQAAVHAGDENTAARGLLTRLGRKALSGTVITADAQHTSTAFTAETEEIGAYWLLPAKGNRPGPHRWLTRLPWNHARADTHDRSRGHGRAETRTVKVLALDDNLRSELLGARQAVRRDWLLLTRSPPTADQPHHPDTTPTRARLVLVTLVPTPPPSARQSHYRQRGYLL